MICTACKTVNQSSARVCLSCGYSLIGNQAGRPIIGMDGKVTPAPPVVLNGAPSPRRVNRFKNPRFIAISILCSIAGLVIVINLANDGTQIENNTSITVETIEQSKQPAPLAVGSEIVSGVNIQLSIVQVVVQESGEDCYSGSGSVIVDQWHVLTSFHIVNPDSNCEIDEIFVETIERIDLAPVRTHRAEVVGVDENADLAILRISPLGNQTAKLVPVTIATSALLGDGLTAIGFPAIGGESVTVTKGEISGFSNFLGIRWIKSSISISAGNSGGGAFNTSGQLVGVPTALGVPGNNETTDCRPDRDTNGDGEVDEDDECVSMGGFINTLSPGSSAIELAKSKGLVP